jgi:hypothetical protein
MATGISLIKTELLATSHQSRWPTRRLLEGWRRTSAFNLGDRGAVAGGAVRQIAPSAAA